MAAAPLFLPGRAFPGGRRKHWRPCCARAPRGACRAASRGCLVLLLRVPVATAAQGLSQCASVPVRPGAQEPPRHRALRARLRAQRVQLLPSGAAVAVAQLVAIYSSWRGGCGCGSSLCARRATVACRCVSSCVAWLCDAWLRAHLLPLPCHRCLQSKECPACRGLPEQLSHTLQALRRGYAGEASKWALL